MNSAVDWTASSASSPAHEQTVSLPSSFAINSADEVNVFSAVCVSVCKVSEKVMNEF